jgi:tRNA A37 threonylcarbamoyladenosine modification protein TsaB
LALANRTRLIGVSTLDILAAGVPPAEGRLVAVAEAGRSRVCTAVYRWQAGKGWQAAEEPRIESWDALLERVEEPALVVGEISPAAAKQVRTAPKKIRLAAPVYSVRRAGHLAEIGWLRLRRGWTDETAQLAPIYLRDPAGATTSQG